MIGKSRKIAQVLVIVLMMLKKGQMENDQRLLTWQIIGMVASLIKMKVPQKEKGCHLQSALLMNRSV